MNDTLNTVGTIIMIITKLRKYNGRLHAFTDNEPAYVLVTRVIRYGKMSRGITPYTHQISTNLLYW